MSTITILDGGTATELVRLGFPAINSDPLWSARLLHTNPEAVKQAHRNFFTKGSDIVVTASYQASVAGFVEHLGVTEEGAVLLIKRSVHLARQAADEVSKDLGCKKGRVAGSVGPYGACLHDGSEYTGNYIEGLSDKELQAWHRPRIGALLEAGTDLLAIETIPCQREAELVVKLLECEFPSSQAWVTFSCKNESDTCHGERFSDAVSAVVNSPCVVAVGLNCTAPQFVTPLLKSIQDLKISKSVIIKPNSGEVYTPDVGWAGRQTVPTFSSLVPEWVSLGAMWVGGCCRVYPDDIEQIKVTLQYSGMRLQ